jgi:hypothetical protein
MPYETLPILTSQGFSKNRIAKLRSLLTAAFMIKRMKAA